MWSFEFIKSLKNADEDKENPTFIKDLTFLCNKMLEGKAGNANWWMSSKLVPIPKNDNDWRPIGIQNRLVKFMMGAIAKSIVEEVTDALKPVQMGIGIKDGQVITYHWVKAKCDTINSGLFEGIILLKADISHAFGIILRKIIRLRSTDFFCLSVKTSTDDANSLRSQRRPAIASSRLD